MSEVLVNAGVADIYRLVTQRELSIVEICQYYLDRLQAAQATYNACTVICTDSALARAHELDQLSTEQLARLPLAGIPYVHKDNYCTAGLATTCASKMLANFVPNYDATVSQRLSEAGAIMLAKSNMDEFAMGSSNETSHFGPVCNPWDIERVPGGSSGGAAVAVAARLVPLATGTDTGGSVRQPASFCGVTGLKPTYGRVSRYGIVAFASSFDQAGLLAQNAADIAQTLLSIAGYDAKDSTCVDVPVPHYAAELDRPLTGLRLGVCPDLFDVGIDQAVAAQARQAIEVFQQLGATLVPVDLKLYHQSVAVYQILSCAECSSNLGRYDGVRYGHRSESAKTLAELYEQSRSEGFGDEVKRRIILGSFVLASGYQDRYYHKAQKLRRLICQEYLHALESVDVLISPTSPSTAFKLQENIDDPLKMYAADSLTAAANLTGLPAISFNGGFVDGLPVGVQLLANYWAESLLLNCAHQYQQQTDWHEKQPNKV